MSQLSEMSIDEDKLFSSLDYVLRCAQGLGLRNAGVCIEDALDDLNTYFRRLPWQVAEDRAERAQELEMERR